MGNTIEATTRIQEAIDSNSTNLNLSRLSLTTDELNALMPKIQQIGELQTLNLGNNKLTTLPETIGTLGHLNKLLLTENQLASLPDAIGNLTNVSILDLSENNLTTLPPAMGDLASLKWINVFSNNLTSFPDTMGDLPELRTIIAHFNQIQTLPETLANLQNITQLALTANPLTEETIAFLDHTFDQRALYNRAGSDTLSDYRAVLTKIYGKEEVAAMVDIIDTLDPSWSFINGSGIALDAQKRLNKPNVDLATATEQEATALQHQIRLDQAMVQQNTLSAKQAAIGFLKKMPPGSSEGLKVYWEGAKHLMAPLKNASAPESEKRMALQNMAAALGDCATPVKDLLVQAYIGSYSNLNKSQELPEAIQALTLEKTEELPEAVHALVVREALEKEALGSLAKLEVNGEKVLRENEMTEQLKGLSNAVFGENAATNPHNKIKINFPKGTRPIPLPSKTEYENFAFDQVKPALAEAFAKRCCQTSDDGANTLLKDARGHYLFDVAKLNAIVEKYYSEDLGIISEREKAITGLKEGVHKALSDTNLYLLDHVKEVHPLLNTNALARRSREKLAVVPDGEILSTAEVLLTEKTGEIKTLATKYSAEIKRAASTPNMSALTTPKNLDERIEKPQKRAASPPKTEGRTRSKSPSQSS